MTSIKNKCVKFPQWKFYLVGSSQTAKLPCFLIEITEFNTDYAKNNLIHTIIVLIAFILIKYLNYHKNFYRIYNSVNATNFIKIRRPHATRCRRHTPFSLSKKVQWSLKFHVNKLALFWTSLPILNYTFLIRIR